MPENAGFNLNGGLSASNAGSDRRGVETCEGVGVDEVQRRGSGACVVVAGSGSEGGTLTTKQRWSRESYNAYQRDYMRKRRGG